MSKTIYDLQSAEWEKSVEMHYILRKGIESFHHLISKGYGVYPEILTFMVSLGYEEEIEDILNVAKKYDPHALREWLEAYYGEDWKLKVAIYKLVEIARYSFSAEECAEFGFWEALKWQSCWRSKELLTEKFGMQYLFDLCDQWRTLINQCKASETIIERFNDLERYFSSREEFAYLYKHKSWKALSRQLKAFEYLAKIHDYSAIILCVIGGVPLSREAKCYVREVLSQADLNKAQKEQFKQLRRGCLLEV